MFINKMCALLLYYLALIGFISAASATTLKSVTFHAPSMASCWVPISPDNALAQPKHTFVEVWNEDNPNEWQPVCYVSGCSARVSALFKIDEGACTFGFGSSQIYAKAVSSDLKYHLPPKPLTTRGAYPESYFLEAFDRHIVQFMPNFKINWYVSSDPEDESSWRLVGHSFNNLYVLHQVPNTEPGSVGVYGEGTSFLHTCIHISCAGANGRGQAGGGPDSDNVVDGIYSEFVDRCVKKVNGGDCMSYWGSATSPSCVLLQDFLQIGDAKCQEWSVFFNNMLRIHGISNSKINNVFYGELSGDIGFLREDIHNLFVTDAIDFFGPEVDRISFLQNAQHHAAGYIFVKDNLFNSSDKFYYDANVNTNSNNLPKPNNHVIAASNVTGKPAQGNNDPKSTFNNHAVVRYKQKYYDPSYGTGVFNDQYQWEANSLSGVGVKFQYSDKLGKFYDLLWLYSPTNSSQQTTFIE